MLQLVKIKLISTDFWQYNMYRDTGVAIQYIAILQYCKQWDKLFQLSIRRLKIDYNTAI